MYLSALRIENFRQFGQDNRALDIQFNEGVTALVGENDAGKTAVIDAIRYVLQTRDAEYLFKATSTSLGNLLQQPLKPEKPEATYRFQDGADGVDIRMSSIHSEKGKRKGEVSRLDSPLEQLAYRGWFLDAHLAYIHYCLMNHGRCWARSVMDFRVEK